SPSTTRNSPSPGRFPPRPCRHATGLLRRSRSQKNLYSREPARRGKRMTRRTLTNLGGRAAGRPLLSDAARIPAAAIVAVCVVTTGLLGAWLGHGAHTDRVDTVIDARVKAILPGNVKLLEVLARPGGLRTIIGITAVLVLVCLLRRRYRG